MKFPRSSGILLHPTSLPSRSGIGDFGPEAFRFADFLADAGQKIWQVLPLTPTGYGESPYASLSSFAGNPLLISAEKLVEQGYLHARDLVDGPSFPEEVCDFQRAIPYKYGLLRKAAREFRPTSEFTSFVARNHWWLDPYARFIALKNANGGAMWTQWTVHEPEQEEVDLQKFWQFEFYRQWAELREYCAAREIRIMGDIPIYVAYDSADVWANPGSVSNSTREASDARLGRAAGLLQRHRAIVGQSDLSLGSHGGRRVSLVGRALSPDAFSG